MVLFRREAIEHAGAAQPAELPILSPPGWRTYLVGVALLLIGIALALQHTNAHRTVSVQGALLPDRGLIRLAAQVRGFTTDVYVEPGQQVRPGDRLARVVVEVSDQVGAADAYRAAMSQEQSAVLSRIALVQQELRAARARWLVQEENLRRELEAAELAESLQVARLQLAEQTLNALKLGFERGAIGRLDLDRASADQLAERQALAGARQNVVRQRGELRALPALRAEQLGVISSRLGALVQERLAVEQKRLQFDLQQSHDVVAPVAGSIVAIQAGTGRPVEPMSQLFAIVPTGSTLQAELSVPSTALGLVREGQQARLNIEPFPHQKFGSVDGEIIQVGRTLRDVDQKNAPPTFQVLVRLKQHSLSANGQTYLLQPDMRVHGEIRLESRKAWEWLLAPALEAWR